MSLADGAAWEKENGYWDALTRYRLGGCTEFHCLFCRRANLVHDSELASGREIGHAGIPSYSDPRATAR